MFPACLLAGFAGDTCHHDDVKECKVEGDNRFCNATQRHIDKGDIEVGGLGCV
jgi:hypothetical protein